MSKKNIIGLIAAILAVIAALVSSRYHVDIKSPNDSCAAGEMVTARDGTEICTEEGACLYECELDEQCCLGDQKKGCTGPSDPIDVPLSKQGFCSKAEDLCRSRCKGL